MSLYIEYSLVYCEAERHLKADISDDNDGLLVSYTFKHDGALVSVTGSESDYLKRLGDLEQNGKRIFDCWYHPINLHKDMVYELIDASYQSTQFDDVLRLNADASVRYFASDMGL